MLTSTLPRFEGDLQADFVGAQARAWLGARSEDRITIVAPHDHMAARGESHGRLEIRRFRYFLPEKAQGLAYPAILPNLRRNPLLAAQIPSFLTMQYREAKRLVTTQGVDLIYAHWVFPQGLVAWRLSKRLGIPYVLQNHSSDLAVLQRSRIGRSLARKILQGARHFFCVNSAQKKMALDLFDGPVREEFAAKCTVLPMGVEPLDPARAGQMRFDIGTIGRLSRKKGLVQLIAAAENLAQQGVRPRIGIAGDGEDRALLKSLCKHADITFTGFLSGQEKAQFLQRCARFVFPAKASDGDVEGMPVALLEALICGRPVLASADTNIKLLPEWERLRDHVIFVEDPDDEASLLTALRRLLDTDPDSTSETSAIMRTYLWPNLIEQYLQRIDRA